MTDEDALLAAIVKTPEDDTLRLAYADYLDEIACEARLDAAPFARFIRAHILLSTPELKKPGRPWMNGVRALFRSATTVDYRDACELVDYEHELAQWEADKAARHEARKVCYEWLDRAVYDISAGDRVFAARHTRFVHFAPFVGDGKWDRGFPCAISCTMHYWQVRGPELAKKWPLKTVAFEDRAPYEGTCWYNETRSARGHWARPGPRDPAAWARAGLPEPIFRLLVGPESFANWYTWPDGEQALFFASRAALEWARAV